MRRVSAIAFIVCFAVLTGAAATHAQTGHKSFEVVDDGVPASLTGIPGDPVRGRAIVVKRESTCLLCHSGPFPDQRFQGDLSPDLTGVASRLSEGQIRLRMIDATYLNPATIMPSFYRVEGLTRVAKNVRGKPILTAQEIEDVVAFLMTLKDPT